MMISVVNTLCAEWKKYYVNKQDDLCNHLRVQLINQGCLSAAAIGVHSDVSTREPDPFKQITSDLVHNSSSNSLLIETNCVTLPSYIPMLNVIDAILLLNFHI